MVCAFKQALGCFPSNFLLQLSAEFGDICIGVAFRFKLPKDVRCELKFALRETAAGTLHAQTNSRRIKEPEGLVSQGLLQRLGKFVCRSESRPGIFRHGLCDHLRNAPAYIRIEFRGEYRVFTRDG